MNTILFNNEDEMYQKLKLFINIVYFKILGMFAVSGNYFLNNFMYVYKT